ncbi:kinesin K39 [Seminavis robusta]|uniref:Kinesin K39 n=1 Tax=Seminavis robusta TaxID=568900 RepID=A0A9N8DY84_9STRA|nr:kinesin K39 [Seminavis robusta]|eukprot:Sro459_g147350.1 kinesin K39 (1241) ;mRNA; r:50249-54071
MLRRQHSEPLFADTKSVTSCDTRATAATIHVVTPTNSEQSTMDLTPLQSEITSLRKRLSAAQSLNKRSELLLGQVRVLEEESQRKDERLRVLNDKLHDIQRGLSHIDDERASLQQLAQKLEAEKRKIRQQLELRDTEVLTLVKRCAAQEEKVKESTLLRRKNAVLEGKMNEYKAALAEKETEQTNLDEAESALRACQQRLEHTKRDHDALAGTLQSCLANIKKLTIEKEDWEDERRRLLNRAEVEIEKERLQHLAEMNEMKVNLQSSQDKIEKLEEFMKDKSMSNHMLRKTNSELAKWKTQSTVKLEEYEKQINELMQETLEKQQEVLDMMHSKNGWSSKVKEKEEVIASLQKTNNELSKWNTQSTVKLEEYERQINELMQESKEKQEEILDLTYSKNGWSSKVTEKEEIIASLRNELSDLMSKTMSLSESVDVLKEENKDLQSEVEGLRARAQSFDAWEEERDAMNHCMTVTQDQIQELMEEVVTLQLENEELEDEKLELQEELKASVGSQNDIQNLEKHISDKESNWSWQENSLRAKISSLEAKKQVLQEGNDANSRDAQETIRKLEWTVASRTKDAVSLQKELEAARETEADHVNQIKSLESNLSDTMIQHDQTRAEAEELRAKNNGMEKEVTFAKEALKLSEATIETLQSAIDEKEAELAAVRNSLTSTSDKLTNVTSNSESRDAEVETLRQKLMGYTAKASMTDKQLEEADVRIAQILGELRTANTEKSEAIEAKALLEADLQVTSRYVEDSAASNDTLRQELQDSRASIANLEAKLEKSSANESLLRTALDESEREIAELKTLIPDLESKLAEGAEQEQNLIELQGALDESQSEIEECRNLILDLESRLVERERENEKGQGVLRTALDESQREVKECKKSITDLKLLLQKQGADMEQSTRDELKSLHDSVSDGRKTIARHQEELETLRLALKRAHTDLVLKDDEIRDLKMIDLVDLQEELSSTSEKLTAKESENNDLIGMLETLGVQQLERELAVAEEVNTLKTTIASLKKEYHQSGQGAIELKSTNVALQRRNTLLEKQVQSVTAEKDLVLERETALEKSNAELEATLSERTSLLGEMVEVNKKLQKSVDEQSSAKEEQLKLQEERDDLAEALCQEQSIREVMEAEVSTVNAQVASMKAQMKETNDLMAEKNALADKVKRQENFLKKKIQKEKVLRDRATTSAKNIVTPLQLASARNKARTSTVVRSSTAFDEAATENDDLNWSAILEEELGD